jgi:predicted neutral ceramidase superfamily lipid hydrolase
MIEDVDEATRAEQVCSGQKLAIWAILLNLISIPLLLTPEGALIRVPLVLAAIVLAVLGIVRMSRALGINLMIIVLMAMAMVIPMVSLVILLIVNARASRFLREHGYTVGMFGATKNE